MPELLLERAGIGYRMLLRSARAVYDQRSLGRQARRENVRGSVALNRHGRRSSPASVVLVDDVMTTGATIDEAALVMRLGGYRVIAAATVAFTPDKADIAASMNRRVIAPTHPSNDTEGMISDNGGR